MEIEAKKIAILQKTEIEEWHDNEVQPEGDKTNLCYLVSMNNWHNFQLWHHEDNARRDDMGFEYVYQAKRHIDRHNQLRNNMIESIDESMFHHLQPASGCPVNSETPGMMIDRMSILALKHYHMLEQTQRTDVSPEHIEACQRKLATIEEQLQQLKECLQALIQDVQNKTRTFRLYHQFKMYNDPNLNPQLYKNNVVAE